MDWKETLYKSVMSDAWLKIGLFIIVAGIAVIILRYLLILGFSFTVRQEPPTQPASDTTLASSPMKKEESPKDTVKNPNQEPQVQDNRKGNFSDNQKDGTVIQNYYEKPPPPEDRHVTKEDISGIISMVPSTESPIEVWSNDTNESATFRNEIVNALKKEGYTNVIANQVQLVGASFWGKGRLSIQPKGSVIRVKVNPQ
jgi:hypothetical protein